MEAYPGRSAWAFSHSNTSHYGSAAHCTHSTTNPNPFAASPKTHTPSSEKPSDKTYPKPSYETSRKSHYSMATSPASYYDRCSLKPGKTHTRDIPDFHKIPSPDRSKPAKAASPAFHKKVKPSHSKAQPPPNHSSDHTSCQPQPYNTYR